MMPLEAEEGGLEQCQRIDSAATSDACQTGKNEPQGRRDLAGSAQAGKLRCALEQKRCIVCELEVQIGNSGLQGKFVRWRVRR